MTIKELKIKKSELLLALNKAKQDKNRLTTRELGSETATIEGIIARAYINAGEQEKAVINLISQASCLCDADRFTEAFRIYRKASKLTTLNKTIEWISQTLEKLSIDKPFEEPFQTLVPNIDNNACLRLPQVQAYHAAKDYFSSKLGHVIIQLPVGCGKTGAMSLMPFDISKGRVLAIAPNLEIRRNLFDNLNYHGPKSFLRKFQVLSNGSGPSCAFLDSEANIHDCDTANIIVTNIQQLTAKGASKWLPKLSPDFFDMIIIDEAHHNVAPTWQDTLECFPDTKIISFTATPMRSDGKKVDGERIYRFPIAEAIKDGYIKDIASRRLDPQEIYFNYKGTKRKVTLEEVLELREEQWFSKGIALSRECNESIVDASIQSMNELRESGEAHQIIGVACSIDHAKSIRSLYQQRGLKAEVIHSKMNPEEQDNIRHLLDKRRIDSIIQVQMLGEGANYPHLSVAAIFRPFRHLMPYVQFVGRIMRVIEQNAPGDKRNRGFVVSHVGLNIDRWWNELRAFDSDDEEFFAELANSDHEFILQPETPSDEIPERRRFKSDMRVIEEAIIHFVQERFLLEDAKLLVDDLIQAMSMRGIDFEALGLTKKDLQDKLIAIHKDSKKKGKIKKLSVSPQERRKAGRQRLNERVHSGAKQLLNELKLSVGGYDLPRLYPAAGAQANLPAATILLNKEVFKYLKVGPRERDSLTEEQLTKAHDNIDEIIDKLAQDIREKRGG